MIDQMKSNRKKKKFDQNEDRVKQDGTTNVKFKLAKFIARWEKKLGTAAGAYLQ